MQINKVDNTNSYSSFYGKRFLSENAYYSLESILIRMNSCTEKVHDGDYFKSTILKQIKYNNSVSLEDDRKLVDKIPHNKQMTGLSILKFGSKIVLDIDNKSGEIIDSIKPLYKPWFILMKQIEKTLTEIRANFYDENVVKKEFKTINELTPEGTKKIKKLVLGVEKQRLENVVKELEETSK